MTNEEAIAEAKRIEESIEARILAGEIPPRPTGYERDAHATWFEKHLACVEPTHRFFVRERGEMHCAQCLAPERARAAERAAFWRAPEFATPEAQARLARAVTTSPEGAAKVLAALAEEKTRMTFAHVEQTITTPPTPSQAASLAERLLKPPTKSAHYVDVMKTEAPKRTPRRLQ